MANPNFEVWATKALGYLMVALTALLIVVIAQELMSGSTISIKKLGWCPSYIRVNQPFEYWEALTSHMIIAMVLGLMSNSMLRLGN